MLGNGIADNVLIENCLVENADVGLYVEPQAQGVILRGNRFDNVLQPMTGAIERAVTHPADLVLAAPVRCPSTARRSSTHRLGPNPERARNACR